MSRSLDKKLLEEAGQVSAQTVHRIARLLSDGADPNVRDRTPDNFRSALGLLIGHGHASAVSEMLSGGACVHWPEREISSTALAGGPDKAYGGSPLDALSVALDVLGWAYQDMLLAPEEEDGVLEERERIVEMLLRAGANTSWPDPGTERQSGETFLAPFEMSAVMHADAVVPPRLLGRIIDTIVRVLDASAQASGVRKDVVSSRWESLPDGWSGLSHYPLLCLALKSRMEQELLLANTAQSASPAKPSTPRL